MDDVCDMPEPTTTRIQLPRPTDRLLAVLVDASFLAVVVVCTVAAGAAIRAGQFGGSPLLPPLLGVAAIAVFSYFQGLVTWLSGGQSVGKALAGISIRRANGEHIAQTPTDLLRLILRFSVGYVVFDIFLLASAWCLIDPWRRCPHDIALRTQVVEDRRVAALSLDDRVRRFQSDVEAGLDLVQERWRPFVWIVRWSTRVVVAVESGVVSLLSKAGFLSQASSVVAPSAASSTVGSLVTAVGTATATAVIATAGLGGLDLGLDRSTRFQEIDWTVVDVERRSDGPEDDGEDLDPNEDYIYVDVDVVSTTPGVTLTVPYDWLTLVAADGRELRPSDAYARGPGKRVSGIELFPNREAEVTVVFVAGAEDEFDDGYFELDQQGYLPAAMNGPLAVDESERIDAEFNTTVYDGPFSRDEARVEIVEAFWSRELGTDGDSNLIESPDLSSRRPSIGEIWLLVHYKVTCRQVGISTGGCNVGSGQVAVDGERRNGSFVNGLVSYGETQAFWAAYPVPVEADAVTLAISSDANGETGFEATDLSPLKTLATP